MSRSSCLSESGGEQTLSLYGTFERLTLHLLRDAARRNRLRMPSDVLGWLADLGLEIQATITV